MNWTPPSGCIKIDIDVSKRFITGSTTISFVGKDVFGATVIKEGTKVRDCSIMFVECLAIWEALRTTIKRLLLG